jgi:hypothetical protein
MNEDDRVALVGRQFQNRVVKLGPENVSVLRRRRTERLRHASEYLVMRYGIAILVGLGHSNIRRSNGTGWPFAPRSR